MMERMCDVATGQNFNAIVLILKGDALENYSARSKVCATNEQGLKTLKEWYTTKEKRARILTSWKKIELNLSMADHPIPSKVAVFRTFVAGLKSL